MNTSAATTKFEVGKSYVYGQSVLTIASRTEKTVKTAGGSKCGVKVIDGVEVIGKGTCGSHDTRADRPA